MFLTCMVMLPVPHALPTASVSLEVVRRSAVVRGARHGRRDRTHFVDRARCRVTLHETD
jgi:hypothetical protein